MQIVNLRIEDIHEYENNPRDNEGGVDKCAESIKQYGWKQPIVVDKNGVIIAGHTRYKAAIKLGHKEIPCIIADDLTEEQVRAYRIADNKVADFSFWDNKKLIEELDGLEDLFTGFDMSEIFDNTLDDIGSDILADNTDGITYEVTFKSEDPDKIDKIKQIWDDGELDKYIEYKEMYDNYHDA